MRAARFSIRPPHFQQILPLGLKATALDSLADEDAQITEVLKRTGT